MTVAILVWSSMIKRRHAALLEMPASRPFDGAFLDFRYRWGNRVEIVGYDNIQFTKAQNVLRGMWLEQITKNEKAKQELAKKGMA